MQCTYSQSRASKSLFDILLNSFRQRSHFVNIADTHQPRPKVYAVYLHVSIPTLEARLGLRTSHPTLADPATALRVLADMKRQLSLPRPEDGEGFDKIYTLPESRQPVNGEWTAEDCQSVLRSVEKEGDVESVPRKVIERRSAPTYPTRGRGADNQYRGGYRGRADFRGRGHGYGHRGNAHSGPRESGPYGVESRSWRPLPVVPYRQPMSNPDPYTNAAIRNDRYQLHPSSVLNGKVSGPGPTNAGLQSQP